MTSSKSDNAARMLVVTADDYGLTTHNTDTIIESTRTGTVTRVSALANGFALEYGLRRLAGEPRTIELSVHVNLTEGSAVAPLNVVRPLTDARGVFRYSVGTLWLRYFFAGPQTRSALRQAVRHEIAAQFERVRSVAASHGLAIAAADGHQHVHMIPFVFDALLEQQTPYIRITSELWYPVPGALTASCGARTIPRIILAILARGHRARATARNIATPDTFLGFVFSGRLTYDAIAAGLHAVTGHARTVEIGIHPGTAFRNELDNFAHANREWHYSPWRTRERELLTTPRLAHLCEAFRSNSLAFHQFSAQAARVMRFGISGGISAATNLFLLYIFTTIGIWYVISAALAYGLSIGVSFMLQKFWTFNQAGTDKLARQLGLYTLVQLANLLIYTAGVYALVAYAGMWYLAAAFVMLVLLAFSSFFIFKKLLVSNASRGV